MLINLNEDPHSVFANTKLLSIRLWTVCSSLLVQTCSLWRMGRGEPTRSSSVINIFLRTACSLSLCSRSVSVLPALSFVSAHLFEPSWHPWVFLECNRESYQCTCRAFTRLNLKGRLLLDSSRTRQQHPWNTRRHTRMACRNMCRFCFCFFRKKHKF